MEKRIIAFCLAVLLCFGLIGCAHAGVGSDGGHKESVPESVSESVSEGVSAGEESSEATEESSAESAKDPSEESGVSLGVVFLIDVSGSMYGTDESSRLSLSCKAVTAALGNTDCFGKLDYCAAGNVNGETGLTLLPWTERESLIAGIGNTETAGSTQFYDALARACMCLKSWKGTDEYRSMHVMLFTDGISDEREVEKCKQLFSAESRVTLSLFLVEPEASDAVRTKSLFSDCGNVRIYECSAQSISADVAGDIPFRRQYVL